MNTMQGFLYIMAIQKNLPTLKFFESLHCFCGPFSSHKGLILNRDTTQFPSLFLLIPFFLFFPFPSFFSSLFSFLDHSHTIPQFFILSKVPQVWGGDGNGQKIYIPTIRCDASLLLGCRDLLAEELSSRPPFQAHVYNSPATKKCKKNKTLLV